jgi:hypothetical protein
LAAGGASGGPAWMIQFTPSTRIAALVPLMRTFFLAANETLMNADKQNCLIGVYQRSSAANFSRLAALTASRKRYRLAVSEDSGAGTVACGAMWKRAVNWTVLPFPGSLFSEIAPPINSTRRAEMVSPSPEPP